MSQAFDSELFYGYLLRGEVKNAIRYLADFPEKAELHQKYISLFEKEEYPVLTEDDFLNEILLIYQRYYRDAFYLHLDPKQAAETMKRRFTRVFEISNSDTALGEIEENKISKAFQQRNFHFFGGKTGGYWGPYIWKTTEAKTYEVALPGGVQPYTVCFLDGFLSKSWLDYISFGAVSTGGWTNGDGIICCIKSSYDPESESFQVSLLKHEAQHARDLAAYPAMSQEDLEYRAKLVELIYSQERNLLRQFAYEADSSKETNGHSLAAERILNGVSEKLGITADKIDALSITQIQRVSKKLLSESTAEIKQKYAGK